MFLEEFSETLKSLLISFSCFNRQYNRKGIEIKKLEGHTDSADCLVGLTNSQLASCSEVYSIRV